MNINRNKNNNKVCIIDGENFRGLVKNQTNTSNNTIKELIVAFFVLYTYNKNINYFFIFKNKKEVADCNRLIFKNKNANNIFDPNIFIIYTCQLNINYIKKIKNVKHNIYEKLCWIGSDVRHKHHVWCEYDDFIIYIFIMLFTLQNYKITVYTNDKDFKSFNSIIKFKMYLSNMINIVVHIYNNTGIMSKFSIKKDNVSNIFKNIYKSKINPKYKVKNF